jgi:hypothetical protein
MDYALFCLLIGLFDLAVIELWILSNILIGLLFCMNHFCMPCGV